MKKVFSLFLFSVLGIFLFMGQKSINKPEKWSLDPQQTGIYDPNVISNAPLPQEYDYVNSNSVTKYISSPNGVYAVAPNFRILPRAGSYQSEVIICRHPLNPLIMFGSSNAINNTGTLFISEGVYVTTNGGVNWFGSDTLQGAPIGNHGGDPGPTIDKNGVMIMSHLGYSTSGMFANYSTNNGATWSSTYTIATGSQDKNFATTDDAPSSAFYGRSYVVWSLFSVSSPPIAVSYTTNSGVTWSAAAQINTSVAGHYSQGCDARVGPNGEVYVVWAAPNTSASNVEDFAGFAKSVNGGVTWTVTNNAYDMNGIRGTFPTKNNIRTNGFTRIDVDRSGGARNGWIYVVASERNLAPAGSDPDVVLHKSTDGGVTWSAGVRVNQDPLNNGKYQFFPAIRVDETGGVNIVYYDDRNTASDSSEIYMSRSIDGGITFSDVLVSDHRFQPKTINVSGVATGYMGDYIGITSGNGKIWPIWMDDVSGISQAWTTSIDLGPGITHIPLPNTEQLSGNYAVNCVITPSGSGINPSLTKLLWSRNNLTVTDSLLMTNSGGNNWTANIPANGASATYRYYIKTTDSLNRTSVSPAGAPSVLNSFIAQLDVTKPVIVHTALGNQPKPNWPSTVSATVTDNLGLDSVWVKWYKNTPTPVKQFKLINGGGSSFSAAFNSLNSDVVIGDNIYYRIFAQDNSLAHNTDSTSLYSFQIIDQILCEDFTSATFVPANWSLEYTGTLYWTRNAVSGYGAGSGSAKFDFWSASSGTVQSMVSLTFGSSVAGDSLKFDHAYAPYTNGTTDSLEIQTSTNGGTTYTSLIRMWGNNTSGNLNTVAASGSIFTPTAAQWATKKYSLPVGTNKVKFRARSGFGNNLYLDNICKTSSVIPPSTSAITFATQGYHNVFTNRLNIKDTARFYLRNINSPYAIVDSGKTTVDSVTYTATVTFANAPSGTYYIVVKGRNLLETWSKAGGEVYTRGTPFTYNFTTAAAQAYNSNIKLVGSKYCNYNGDLNQDGIIDVSDVSLVDNASFNGLTGYVTEDVTGDYYVDVSDVSIVDNNSFSGVQVAAPPGAVVISKRSDSRNGNVNNAVSKKPAEGKNYETGKKEIINKDNNIGKENPAKNNDLKK